MAAECGLDLIVHVNEEGVEQGIHPFTHGSALYTDVMKTEGLKQALDKYKFDAAFGGARRDEEKSRAKERIFSFRSANHRWDPKNQRPELWNLYNTRVKPGESIRVFPLSNWTELDVWQYIHLEQIPIVPLYYAAVRPVVERDGMLIMVDDDRLELQPGEKVQYKSVRFRTLGCYPLTGAVESEADTLPEIIQEMLLTRTSERQGRLIDHDSGRVDGEEETGRIFLMAHQSELIEKDILAYLKSQEEKSLLRFITCGSVDDGKSTLIGRLLWDSKMVFEDQLAALESGQQKGRHPGGGHRLCPAAGRPAGGAGAGDHHRRGLPLLLHRQAQVHRRRHPRPRAVHPQHGHRRLHRPGGGHPGGCPQGAADPDQAPQLSGLPGRHPQCRAGDQQDGPGRFRRTQRFEAIRAGLRSSSPHRSALPRSPPSRSRPSNGDNMIEPSANTPWYAGPDPDGATWKPCRDRG